MESIQDILNELEKDKNTQKKPEKTKKRMEFDEKKYFKEIILEDIKKGIPIEPYELSVRLGTEKSFMEELIKEINEERKVVEVNKPKKENKIKNSIKINKEKLKKVLDKDDKETLKDFFLKIVLFGIPINFALWIVSKGFFPFNFYTWVGWGIVPLILEKKISPFLRGVIHK